MRKKKYQLILLFCVVFILGAITFPHSHNSNAPSRSLNLETLDNFKIKASSNSKIIIINNNYELNQTATSGNGTLSNPYIIEDLTINGNGSLYSILINNTNKFFTIRDCKLFNSTYGIYMHNVSNGEISNNQIYDNLETGIFMSDSVNNSILINTIFNNRIYGIFSQESNLTKIIGNHIYNNNYTGIYLSMSNSNDVMLNSIDYHQYALFLHSSNHSSFIYNEGVNNQYSIEQVNCIENIFNENSFKIISSSRTLDGDGSDDDYEEVIIDFTIVLVSCFLVFAVFFSSRRKL